MALSLRKQTVRSLLVILALTPIILFLSHSDLRLPFTQPAHVQSAGYTHRRIQDYSSPEYTAPGDVNGDSARASIGEQPNDQKGSEIPEDIILKSNSLGTTSEQRLNQSDHHADITVKEKTGSNGEGPKGDVMLLNKGSTTESSHIEPSQAKTPKHSTKEVKVTTSTQDPSANSLKDASAKDDEAVERSEGVRESYPSGAKDTFVRNMTKQELIDSIVNEKRALLAEELQGYKFHRKLKVKKLDNLVLEKGGQPVRSVVITTWRSGSTFIGDVLLSHLATYYHYEPLLDFDIQQVRYGETAKTAIHNLRHLFNCNYTDMDHYLEYGPEHPWLFLHNVKLWQYCTEFPQICFDPDFLSRFCSLFPFQLVKTVRLRLNLTREFLQDKKLGVQVLLLVRDPRGTMQSRRHRDWCPGNPDCEDPAKLCSDLVSDYKTATDFKKKFPNSFRVVRYEDLSFNAYNMTRDLFDFFHLSYDTSVENFLDTHTKIKIGGESSTFRDSKVAPVHWQQDLDWSDVNKIQQVCSKALRLWNYEIAKDEDHLRTFNPIGVFKF